MLIAIGILALVLAGIGFSLSLALAIRVKHMLDNEFDVTKWHPDSIRPGTLVPRYSEMIDVDGVPWEASGEEGEPWMLAFLSSDCRGCKEQLPQYKKFLRDQGIPRDRTVSVVLSDDSGLADLEVELGGASRIVHIEETAPIIVDLKVMNWPTYVVVAPDSRVSFATGSVSRLANHGL